MAAWGEVRATPDVDLICRAQDIEGLKSILRKSNIDFEHRVGDLDDPISDVLRIQAGSTGASYEIDLLAGIREAPAGVLERAHTVRIDDLEIPVASPEDMIILKLLAGSARDLEDARAILRAQVGTVDLALLRELCPELTKADLERLLEPESR